MSLNRLFSFALYTSLFVNPDGMVAAAISAHQKSPSTIQNKNKVESLSEPEILWIKHLVRIRSTVQSYQFRHPWAKNVPITKSGVGVILQGGNALVTAELVANHTYVEMENPRTSERRPAEVIRIDYDCNLALIHPASFFTDLMPCELDLHAKSGDPIHILQLQSNGQLNAISGNLTTTTVTPYPQGTDSLLIFRVSAPVSTRNHDLTQPVVRGQKLTGLVMQSDSRNQNYEIIPARVIQQFVKNKLRYAGVPRLGLSTTSAQDPQLRKWLNLPKSGGVYICQVEENGPAAKVGLQRGNILFAVDGHDVDEQGNIDDPDFGKINFNYLISTEHNIGDQVTVKIFQNGKFFGKKITLAAQSPEETLSPAYVIDREPGYFILGGLVFMELSRPYLQEWGADWKKRAPQRLVYIDQYQKELSHFRGKIVFLSEVLPSENTMGFDSLSHLILTKVNGYPIHSLTDLANAATQPIAGLQKIEFLEDPHMVYLDAMAAAKADLKLIKDYSIPATTNVEVPSKNN